MASTSLPVEQPVAKPSFAKVSSQRPSHIGQSGARGPDSAQVAASAYKPQINKKDNVSVRAPVVVPQLAIHSNTSNRFTQSSTDAPKVRIHHEQQQGAKEKAGNTAETPTHSSSMAGQNLMPLSAPKDGPADKPRLPILVKSEDSSTQLSSSDGSAKPASLDGKSVASVTTFALDEKESLRPDDSASLRAVEEDNVTSPPDSVAAGSRVGSDSGARAFHEQLHEIAVMGPRGAPPGRFPILNANGPTILYDPSQPANGIGAPLSQPLENGMQVVSGPHNVLPTVPDEKLIEALESPRDRLFVLKLEQDFIDFIKDPRENEFLLPNCNTFYRMLAHRLADYYLLGHVVDNTMTGVKIKRTPYCRMPAPLSAVPVSSKTTNTPPVDLPTRKIMRREDAKSGTNTTANSEGPSKTTSEAGGGSGSDNGADGNDKDKSLLTREEREARYREARERIFGNGENGEGDSNEALGTVEEKDVSRSSSASGKKKNKKQRNFEDDGFEARSRFNAFYPQQYTVSGYGGEGPMYYAGYPPQMQNPQFATMNANVPAPGAYHNGYPAMIPPDTQPQYDWSGQQYPSPQNPMAYPAYSPAQNGYDMSGDYQRSMQTFQPPAVPSQVTPKMANTPMASYADPYQAQAMAQNQAWQQMNQQPTYAMNQSTYSQNGQGNRPMSAPSQGPVPNAYQYGQFPPSPYNGKPHRNQHPLPGSFNRQQFNPQSQTFVPGGRNMPYQMQPNMGQLGSQGMNGYGNYTMPGPPQMSGMSPSIPHAQPYAAVRSMQHNSSAPSRTATSSQPTSNAVQSQSSIAKWGTPAHLPAKPPPIAPSQNTKFSLPAHGYSPLPRIPNMPSAMTPGFAINNAPMMRGGAGPNSGQAS
ncbi:hypothetical protein P154DRAFT_440947 [Amniculicola lignicola CBS 123094]|uniref:SUZ domain-containing protein n=1 Tax=Amniculicola lignicola CBS 123094 TaxID=1392246 RepID=A0A6A5W6M6_9PLEO|nr:hypothetical protein P154DRAFT_440947 [Amniculicola lignicola CBS 123094]